MREIDVLSAVPLWVSAVRNGEEISHATGFIVRERGTDFLFTNWHVVTGKNNETDEREIAEPDHLTVWHHVEPSIGHWETSTYPLRDHLWEPTWIAHPLGRLIDVVALPISVPDNAMNTPVDLGMADANLDVWAGDPVFVIGYPSRMASMGKLPVWKTGHIASDPEIDYDRRPILLIDATTKKGMSGSPVFARQSPVYRRSDGRIVSGTRTRFLGIYSGHFHQVDVGRVWKPRVIREIVDRA